MAHRNWNAFPPINPCHSIEVVGEGNDDMLNLNQSATLPGAIASLHPCRESIFNISNRAPAIRPDADPGKKPDLGEQRDVLHAVLARIGCGQVLLKRGCVLDVSAIGRAILERECNLTTSPETLYSAVKQLVNRAGAQIPVGSTSWLATSFKEGVTSLVSQMVNVWTDETSTIILLDLDAHPEPTPQALRCLFGFTAAETQLAVELARGHNLLDIARARRLSRTTIRSHLASLFVKTQTRRQAELVALLGRVAVLPSPGN
ncbi:helix-turn-helix transcriptional regulator [Tardiphaga robiniae]|jgi:DNA-binding CsgD family transcriptional regulator|nr:helix-turn-helix transcriptional regulator [Tardiphaga robiniae]